MNVQRRYRGALTALTLLATTAAAPAADNSSDRYTMSPADGGFLRLDKQTGAVSMCARSGSTWACTPVEDHTPVGAAKDDSRLEHENKELKDRVDSLEEMLEAAKPLPPEGPPPDNKLQLPTDQEVDQALNYLERVYKKVRDRMKDLDKPLPPPEGAPPPPPGSAPSPPPPPPKGTL